MLKNHDPPIPQSGLVHMLFPTGGATGSSVFQSISPVHGQIVRKPTTPVKPLQVKASKSFITPLVQQAQACNMKSDISPALSKSSNLSLLTIIS